MLMGTQAVRTASPEKSIWREIPEETFRQHLVHLETRTNAVPVDVQTFTTQSAKTIANDKDEKRQIPLAVEHRLANDIAFIAAVQEGAQSVAAVCLYEKTDQPGLKIVLAAVDAVGVNIKTSLQNIFKHLETSASGKYEVPSGGELLRMCVGLHYARILGRLRSVKWQKPSHLSRSHKKPLWQDFDNVIHRVQFLYTKKEATIKTSVKAQLQSLAALFQQFELIPAGSSHEFEHMLDLVEASYFMCTSGDVRDYVHRLETTRATAQIAAATKCLRQVEKLGAYWRIANFLIQTANAYPALFSEIFLEWLTPYESVPTSKAYESWAKTCHVHAEVQLILHIDMDRSSRGSAPLFEPRVVGTSKYLCFLCYLFLLHHGRFAPANTHGRLYDQWTIPDLESFSSSYRSKYAAVIHQIDREICRLAAEPCRWRPEPMTSRQNLLEENT